MCCVVTVVFDFDRLLSANLGYFCGYDGFHEENSRYRRTRFVNMLIPLYLMVPFKTTRNKSLWFSSKICFK